MRTRRSAKLIENTQSSPETKEEDSVIDESHVLLDFKEFHSTEIFQGSTFNLISSDKKQGTVYKIDNSSFNKISFNNFETDTPTCLINDYLPLNGTHVSNGMTYILVDKESLNKTSDTKYDGDSNSGNKIRYWFTDKSVEFNTDK
ncbi:conserved hypothetical protein [Theileria orientalis strain Shintoku]|uniref:Uncharacterized protein n=1 Tax=Theileria orientalis strain Shintoku TaxID=869250 RepID=J4C3B1_THEOR|nr:conserved hypothetical protein [Theileria orientalis strain Shintoku]BAM40131.1 conserved hypothetical protein [Theileria orientalis strain Shintoku]|eukprot:XP_009690432.1 conserved hypothetical protein [Theileria orientalis strain Shintoku]